MVSKCKIWLPSLYWPLTFYTVIYKCIMWWSITPLWWKRLLMAGVGNISPKMSVVFPASFACLNFAEAPNWFHIWTILTSMLVRKFDDLILILLGLQNHMLFIHLSNFFFVIFWRNLSNFYLIIFAVLEVNAKSKTNGGLHECVAVSYHWILFFLCNMVQIFTVLLTTFSC